MYDHAHRKKKYLCTLIMRNLGIFLTMVILSACSNDNSNPAVTKSTGGKSTSKEAKVDGKSIYLKHCMECHQENGEGVPNIYPTLQNAEWVGADKAYLIEILLNGLTKQIVVKGIIYEDEMPKADYLTNKEIAAVLNYIRTNFANQPGSISEVDVAKTRIRLKAKK